jgi:histidinol-phosphate aminotransferase
MRADETPESDDNQPSEENRDQANRDPSHLPPLISHLSPLISPVPWVQRMAPYAPPEPLEPIARRAGKDVEELIKLDANENPYGPSPKVAKALAAYPGYHRYPDPGQGRIRPLVAKYAGVDPSSVMLFNGSDELIDLLCRIYLQPGDEVVDNTPTFGMYVFSTELCGGVRIEAPRTEGWAVDVAAIERALTPRTKLNFVASPNNPSGNRESEATIAALLATGRIVVLDEAYVEFAKGPSFVNMVAEHPNLVVIRTFSKWAGLAGQRVGYGILPAHIAEVLWKVKPPFNVNLAAEVAVEATLDDLPAMWEKVERIRAERDRMYQLLCEIPGIHIWPSEANFFLIRVLAGAAPGLKEHLALRGITIRAYSHPRLHDCVRISVGLPEHTDAVVAAVREWCVREGAST